MNDFLTELSRRNVFRVAAVYAVVSWLVIQIADVILPTFDAPQWVNQTLIIILALGFPVALVLAWAVQLSSESVVEIATADSPAGATVRNQSWNSAVLGLLVLAIAFLFIDRYWLQPGAAVSPSDASTDQAVTRSSINLGYFARFNPRDFRARHAITPDGRSLLYTAFVSGKRQLFLRDLDSFSSQLLLENDNNQTIFFDDQSISPDGSQLHVVIGSNEMLISLEGGIRRELADPRLLTSETMYSGRGYEWFSRDALIYSSSSGKLVVRSLVDDSLTELSIPGEQNKSIYWPQMLPGEKSVLYTASAGEVELDGTIGVYDLETKESKTLINGGFKGRYVESGHIVFARDNALYAAAVDLDTLQITSPETNVIDNLEVVTGTWGRANFSVSATGRLVYEEGGDLINNSSRSFVLKNREGEETRLDIDTTGWGRLRLSPDGSKVLLLTQTGGRSGDVYVYFTENGGLDRRTYNSVLTPIWDRNGESFVYTTQNERGFELYRMAVSGLGQPELLYSTTSRFEPFGFTPDSSQVLLAVGLPGREDLAQVELSHEAPEQTPLVEDFNSNDTNVSISPDGRWIAYNGAGSLMFVRPYPNVNDGVFQLGQESGLEPRWGPNGDEIFYYSEGILYRLPVSTEEGFQRGRPEPLFNGLAAVGRDFVYDVSADGQIFLLPQATEETEGADMPQFTSLNLVDNWFVELQRLVPPRL